MVSSLHDGAVSSYVDSTVWSHTVIFGGTPEPTVISMTESCLFFYGSLFPPQKKGYPYDIAQNFDLLT